MRFSTFQLLVPALLLFSPGQVQAEFNPVQMIHSYLLDSHPNFTVRCVKDNNWPGGIVGNVGAKPFCFGSWRFNQCDADANTVECNEKFPECDGKCTAFAPIPI